jgi:hypothetical protein
MAAAEAQGDNLTDDDLQSEIELVGDLVVAATSSKGPLPQDEIDRLLGVATAKDSDSAEDAVHPAEDEPPAEPGT